MACTGDTVGIYPVRCTTVGGGTNRAGDRERVEVHEVERISFVIRERSNDVRTVIAFAATAEIIFKVVIHLEWLAALQGKCVVETPAVFQPLHVAAMIRHSVVEDPGESLRKIEVRRPIFQVWPGTVVWLRGIRLEVVAIAGVIERF